MVNGVTLGLESSCDDTAAAIVVDGRVLSSVVSSQTEHDSFGGVVPELASRAHQRNVIPVVEAALREADVRKQDLTRIAVTTGPGLIGSLLVGLSFAKALSVGLGIPVYGINHIQGHICSLFLGDNPPTFPFLCLIVSGGHTQLIRINDGFRYDILGRTRDDAAGEAFDKVAKLLDLGYPGGPAIDSAASYGDADFVRFPRTRLTGYDYSFSGIKTSMLYHLNDQPDSERRAYIQRYRNDLCASFQRAVVDMLVQPVERAMEATSIQTVGVAGGVSANRELRSRLEAIAHEHGGRLHAVATRYCTDNAAMIALAGEVRSRTAQDDPESGDPLTLIADPSLSLT